MKPSYENICKSYQIVLDEGQLILYSQQLEGDGYDEYDLPFDMYVIARTPGDLSLVDQNVVEGVSFVSERGEIDWKGLVCRACADNVLAGLDAFANEWNGLYAFDDDEIEDFVTHCMLISLL